MNKILDLNRKEYETPISKVIQIAPSGCLARSGPDSGGSEGTGEEGGNMAPGIGHDYYDLDD